jgi:MFS family permease
MARDLSKRVIMMQKGARDRPTGRKRKARGGGGSGKREPVVPKVSKGASIGLISAEICLFLIGSTIPTPLYSMYQRRFHFSEIVLSLIFASYVIGALLALFLAGGLSDRIGRRWTVMPALLPTALAAVCFIVANNIVWLFAGRVLTGLAVGLSSGTVTAWVSELHPPTRRWHATIDTSSARMLGLALGPFLAGLLSQYAPAPFTLVFVVYLVLLLPAALVPLFARETVRDRVHHLSQVKSAAVRLGIPAALRSRFVPPAGTAFATYSLIGFYAALAPGLLEQGLHITNRAAIGGVIGGFFLAAAISIHLFARLKGRTLMLTSLGLMLPTVALLAVQRQFHSLPFLLGVSALGGIAVGLGSRGSLERINEMAPSAHRAEVVSTYLFCCYAGIVLPVIGIAVLTTLSGPRLAEYIFAATVALFAVVALAVDLGTGGRGK